MSEPLRITQNFLHNQGLIKKLVSMTDLKPGSTVLEIGPGKGIITTTLAEKVTKTGRVVAVEFDPEFVPKLIEIFKDTPQVEIIHADILALDLSILKPDYSVFSNIPFNITSELIDHLFTGLHLPLQAHLILQTDTILNSDGSETFKSLLIKPRYAIRLAHAFSRADYYPRPGVDTDLYQFDRLETPLIAAEQYDLYKDFLAFVSKDRVGEGVWKKVFSTRQLETLADTPSLVYGRGLKSQTVEGIVDAFKLFAAEKSKLPVVSGAMKTLRDEQKRREQINKAGGHHRSKKQT